jgi:kynurenine formamidase
MLSFASPSRLALATLIAVSFSVSAASAETGREVMERVYNQSDIFPQSKATVRLSVLDKKGRERERFFELRTKNAPDFKRSLAKFFKPANVKGVGLASQTNQASQVKKNGCISHR